MSTETLFLLRYGLQNFVKVSKVGKCSRFVIDGSENRTMIDHATSLISEMFGARSEIRVL